MVRFFVVACFVLLLAVPVLAQEDYPRIETSLGYANLSFPDLNTGASGHHSGFANQTSFNLTRSLGLDNYMGIYGLGQGVTLISDFFGGKAMYRAPRFVPYALGGLGIGYFTASTSYGTASTSKFAVRYGGGVDIPINDSMAWKVEISRMSFHLPQFGSTGVQTSSWTSGTNISTGIVFTIAQ
jgi:opacity protein-like surface antigen